MTPEQEVALLLVGGVLLITSAAMGFGLARAAAKPAPRPPEDWTATHQAYAQALRESECDAYDQGYRDGAEGRAHAYAITALERATPETRTP